MRPLLVALLILAPASALAHGLAPARLELEEGAAGHFRVFLKIPGAGEAAREAPVEPRWPAHCVASRPTVYPAPDHVALDFELECGAEGLTGHRVTLTGLAPRQIDALVAVTRVDGEALQFVLRPAEPGFVLPPRLTVGAAAKTGLLAALRAGGAGGLALWLAIAVLLGATFTRAPARRAAPWVVLGAALGGLLPGAAGAGLALALLVAVGLGPRPAWAGPWQAGLTAALVSLVPMALALPPEHLRLGQAALYLGALALAAAGVVVGALRPQLALRGWPTSRP